MSFVSGCLDAEGRRAGGSQILHLVSHKGALYAASGYWMDSRNVRYGGTDRTTGWAQVLRLTSAERPWQVDLELGATHMRTELLASVSFRQDAQGRPLDQPNTLLIAATYDAGGIPRLFIRNDTTGQWQRTTPLSRPTGLRGEDNSIRKALVHQDRVTGREHLFLSVGVFGLLRADYDPTRLEPLTWSDVPEFVPARTRILGLTVANGILFVSDGQSIWRRVDGPQPRYEKIADFTDQVDTGTPRETFSAIGGIRGLSAIQGPIPGQQSLLLVWHDGRLARGCVKRLDPSDDGHWRQHDEVCLADLAAARLGTRVSFVIGAYNEFLALNDRQGQIHHVTGMQAFLTHSDAFVLTAKNQRNRFGGYYGGALVALRGPSGQWRLDEVNGRFQPGNPELVAAYTAVPSPFGGHDEGYLYFGGYDPNFFPSTETAWVYRGHIGSLLQPQHQDAPGPH